MNHWRIIVSRALALLGIGLLFWTGSTWAAAAIYQRRAQHRFAVMQAAYRTTPSVAEPLQPGGILGEIDVPRLGVESMVIEGDSPRVLVHGAGHVPGTALPGQPGNVAIAAHRDSYFRPLKDLRVGDTIDVTTLAAHYSYRVTGTEIVDPSDVAVIAPTRTSQLTLVTCYPFYYVGPAPKRFIVHAVPLAPSR